MFPSIYFLILLAVYSAECVEIVQINPNTSENIGKAVDDHRGCLMSDYQGYNDVFLRGAREEVFLTYNETSFEDCMNLCCQEKKFDCMSFSYFVPLRVCWVMNVTDDHDTARMEYAAQWKHYHRIMPKDKTTTTHEMTTQTSTSAQGEPEVNSSEMNPISNKPTTSTMNLGNFATTSGRVQSYVKTLPDLTSSTNDVTTYKNDKNYTSSSSFGMTYPVKILPGTETAATDSNAPQKDLQSGLLDRISAANKSTTTSKDLTAECRGECKHGGSCKVVIESDEEGSNKYVSKCFCKPGYLGSYCENKEVITRGVPPYVIAVAVLGGLILILFTTLLILYLLYRKRTGKYRVKEERKRWKKRAETQTRRSQSFQSLHQRSSAGSEFSAPGSVLSTGTRSTTTSV